MLGHLDVVPVDNEWITNPFELVIKDGIGFGRGILDDKGPTMAAYYALKMIKELPEDTGSDGNIIQLNF